MKVFVQAATRTTLDRLVLLNGLVSLVCGTALVGAAGWWSRQLGDVGEGWVMTTGIGLAGYAWVLALVAGKGATAEAGRLLALLDAGWVVGTAGLLSVFAEQLTRTGLAVTVGCAVVIAGLGWGQWSAAARIDPVPRRDASAPTPPSTRHTDGVAHA